MSRYAQNPDSSSISGWSGNLELDLQRINKRTVLGKIQRVGPLCVQRPFYPEGETCHLYLLHPPGGLVGGDDLSCLVRLKPDTQALITTPAAQKVYRSNTQSHWSATLNVEKNATLEWLPQDTILFGGSQFNTRTNINLHCEARFCGWETTSLGRPAAGDNYATGSLSQRLKLNIDDKPVLIEQLTVDAKDTYLTELTGLQNFPIFATLLAYPADQELLDQLRENLDDRLLGLSVVDNLLVARLLAKDVQTIVRKLHIIWSCWRKVICRKEACVPRVWCT